MVEKPTYSDVPEGFVVADTKDPIASVFQPTIDFSKGTRLGLSNAKAGAEQLYETAVTGARDFLGLADDDEKNKSEERGSQLKSEIAMRDLKIGSLGLPGQAGAIVGETLPSMLAPGGAAGGVAKRLGTGIVADTAASIADPVREDETRLGNLGQAATGSTVFRGAGGLVSGAFRKLSNAKAGNYADEDIRKLVDEADANDIPIFFDDATQAPLALKLSTAAEYFGRVGTGAGRAKQNEKASEAANNFLAKFTGDPDNYDEIVQEGLKNKLNIFKSAAAKKYARVMNEIASKGPVEPLDTKSFESAAEAGIASEMAKGTRANQEVIDFLQKYKDAPKGNFEEMIEFRSDLLADVRNMSDDVNFTSTKALMQAQEALDKDMADYAKKHGAESSWRAANEFYKNTVLQFKIGKLKNMVNERSAANFDAQSAWSYLAANKANPKRAKLMWQSLDARGRNAVRVGLLDEAMEAATKKGKPFSPAMFAGYLEKKLPVADEFFRGASGEQIKGLIKVMRHIERAGQYAENPPTGARLIPWLLAGTTYIEPTTAAATGTAALSVKGAFQTKFGRDLLLASNKATPGSKEFDKILEAMERAAARGSN